jgi:predicted membrane protein
MRGGEMNVSNLLKNVTAVDVVAFVLFLMALCIYFFTGDEAGALYMNTAALFFFGISFIVDAIANIETRVLIIASTEHDHTKPTIQE